jgi:hypothetical protein
MVKTAKYYDCPNCGIKSRLRRNWVVKNLSYPNGIIHVRGREDIKSVQDAWAYASEVCLYMSKRVLEYPPSDSLDSEMANQLYDHFRTVMPHTNEEIAEFEIIHRENISARMTSQQKQQKISHKINPQPDYDVIPVTVKHTSRHKPVAPDAGRITRLSLALLYGSIVLYVIHDSLRDLPITDCGKIFAQAIYTSYSIFYSDNRMKKDWKGWLELMADAKAGGYGWSAWKHRVKASDDKSRFKKITTRYMKRKESEVEEKVHDILKYTNKFEDFFLKYGLFVKSNVLQTIGFRRQFEKLQFKPYQRDIIYEYAEYIHDDKSSKPYKHTISRQVMAAEEEAEKKDKNMKT